MQATNVLALLPPDLLEQCIFCRLPLPSLISSLLSGSRPLRTAAQKVINGIRQRLQLKSTPEFQKKVLKLLFKTEGSVALAEWFEEYLHFPVFENIDNNVWLSNKCRQLAARGKQVHGSWQILNCNLYLGGFLEMLQRAIFSADIPEIQAGSICASAACGGHLHVLTWAREIGCDWDENTCTFAAERGHLEVLKWARENGCPWDQQTERLARETLNYTEKSQKKKKPRTK